MKKNLYILIISLFFLMPEAHASQAVFQFLDLPVSARMAALGGKNISISDNDINFSLLNPSLLNKNTHNMIGLNMASYLADIKFGSAVYSRSYDENNFALGVQYVDYGRFKEVDEFNQILGDFTAKDISMSLIYSRNIIDNLYGGATLKPIYSAYERYTSFGFALDLGFNYMSNNELFSAGLLFKNIGTQLKGYYKNPEGQHYEPLPFDMQIGASYKLEHAPLRFSFTMYNLHDWRIPYVDNTNSLHEYDHQDMVPTVKFIDNFFRHTIIGLEFLPSKSFYLAASYNHRRHQELKMQGFKSVTGFAFGGGVKLSHFHIGFSVSQFQVGNSAYLFSVSVPLSDFRL